MAEKNARTPLIEICVEGIDGLLAARAGWRRPGRAVRQPGRRRHHAELRHGARGAQAGERFRSMSSCGRAAAISSIRDTEFASMVADVAALRDLGVAGVVVGCLRRRRRHRRGAHARAGRGRRPARRHLPPRLRHDARSGRGAGSADPRRRRPRADQRPARHRDRRRGTAGGAGQAGRRTASSSSAAARSTPATSPTVRASTGLTEMHFAALKDVPSGMRLPQPACRHGRHRPRPRIPQHADRRRGRRGDDCRRPKRMTS